MKNIQHWPPGLPLHLSLPQTPLHFNLEVSAQRYPNRAAIVYYDNIINYAELKRQVDALVGFLQHQFHIIKGDRVALYLQNSPQSIIAYYAILRIGAIVVPINAMNVGPEIAHLMHDSGCKVMIYGQELEQHLIDLQERELVHCIAVNYADFINPNTDLPLPDAFVTQTTSSAKWKWREILQLELVPTTVEVTADDLALLAYTSGTTGKPKGCMHTYQSIMHTAIAPPNVQIQQR